MMTFIFNRKIRLADFIIILFITMLSSNIYAVPLKKTSVPNVSTLGKYYPKKTYSGGEIPTFKESKGKLPRPIFDDKPAYIDFYYKAWEIGFDHFKKPQKSSPFVSNFIDEAFNENIFFNHVNI